MIQPPAIVLVFALHAGLSVAQQYPLPVTYDTVIKSPIDPSITISYKTPDAHSCATAFEEQKQYTGYVNLPPFTLEPFHQDYSINTFFWFFEARENPETAPLTIWLNGGPGSSSMFGLFGEMGPCEIVEGPDGSYTTQTRIWGWDRSSNVLFIDQPTQVGFSYDELRNASVDFSIPDYTGRDELMEPSPLPADAPEWRFKNGTFPSAIRANTENLTIVAAQASWHFLQGFLSAFPQYNPGARPHSDTVEPCHVNLFSESYGGTYGPLFADYYESQNDRREKGEISSEALDIRLGSLGIVNGAMDVYGSALFGLEFMYNNTYGIEGIDLTTYQNLVSELHVDMGCQDLVRQCGASAALNDPEGLGTNQDVNDLCYSAIYNCTAVSSVAYTTGRSIYDFRAGPTVGPAVPLAEYLNGEGFLQSIGAPVNFTSTSYTVANVFQYNGDAARGGQIAALADLLARGIKVALIYGDADVICNWYGGQNYSLEIAGLVPGYKTAFPEAGYADIVVNDSYIGGAVRQYGNLSFSRIYDAGHQVPYYQPETAFTVFTRVIQGDDISMGRSVDLSSFGTEGPSTSDHKNDAGTSPAPICWIREAYLSCTEEENAGISAGNGTVKAGIWYPSEEDIPTRASQGVPKSRPTSTTSVALTGVYSATSTPTVKQTSGASSLRLNLPFRLSRRDIHADLLLEEDEAYSHGRNVRNGLIGGLAAAIALLLGLLSMLCCCRCFRRREVYKGPFPDDGERGPIVVKQMIDDGPAPTYSGRPIARLDPIPEASPRPSDDLRDRTAIASGQPVSMPNMEEDPFVSPVQRSTPLLQDAGPLTRAPSRWPTETIAVPTPPPEPDVVAPLELAMSVPPTPPEPLPTTTVPIKTPSPTPAQPVPPLLESTPSRGQVPKLVQHTTTSPPSSPLHTPISVPPSPGPEPIIATLLAPPQPSLYTRIKSMFIAIPGGQEAAVQTDGSVDRRVLLPRVVVRLPSSKRAPKAAIPTWSTEVWL